MFSVSTATRKPFPLPPMMLNAGTRQPSRMIWQVDEAQRPSFFSSTPREKPGSVPSSFATTAKQATSLCEPGSIPASGMRAKIVKNFAKPPLLIHCFVPVRTYSSVAAS